MTEQINKLQQEKPTKQEWLDMKPWARRTYQFAHKRGVADKWLQDYRFYATPQWTGQEMRLFEVMGTTLNIELYLA